MTRTANLRQQHDIILKKAMGVQDMARGLEENGDIRPLMRKLHRLDGVLSAHLAAEDSELYPEMAQSRDPRTAATAQRFMEEMGGLSEVYRAFVCEWSDEDRIRSDPRGFRSAFTRIVFALSNRIHRENNELYPLADAMADRTRTRKQA